MATVKKKKITVLCSESHDTIRILSDVSEKASIIVDTLDTLQTSSLNLCSGSSLLGLLDRYRRVRGADSSTGVLINILRVDHFGGPEWNNDPRYLPRYDRCHGNGNKRGIKTTKQQHSAMFY